MPYFPSTMLSLLPITIKLVHITLDPFSTQTITNSLVANILKVKGENIPFAFLRLLVYCYPLDLCF